MSTLYIVPTPIGNMKDITLRALEVLKRVEYIACEDTRRTLKLLNFYEIKNKKLLSYYYPKEREKMRPILNILKEGKDVALVSDSGTPLISDPGYLLVTKCIEEGIRVEALPGPTAFVPALVASGLQIDRFIFLGFPPKRGARKFWEEIGKLEYITVVFYESPSRIKKTLSLLKEVFGDIDVVIAKEITKLNEEFIRGDISHILESLPEDKIKGEFVVVFRLC